MQGPPWLPPAFGHRGNDSWPTWQKHPRGSILGGGEWLCPGSCIFPEACTPALEAPPVLSVSPTPGWGRPVFPKATVPLKSQEPTQNSDLMRHPSPTWLPHPTAYPGLSFVPAQWVGGTPKQGPGRGSSGRIPQGRGSNAGFFSPNTLACGVQGCRRGCTGVAHPAAQAQTPLAVSPSLSNREDHG